MIRTNLFKYDYIESNRKSDKLMIVLHGRGDSSKPFRTFNEELNLMDFNYLLLNAPRKYMDGYSWYGEPPYQKQGVLKIREMLFELLSDLNKQGWKSENIFLFGFSQGCLVSADLGINYPKKLGGVIGISGYFHFFPRWKQRLNENNIKTPWLFTHGINDDILPVEDTKFGVSRLEQVGLDVTWVESEKAHDLEEEEYPIIRKWIRDQISS